MRTLTFIVLATMLAAAGCGGAYEDPFSQPRRETDPGAFGVSVDPFGSAASGAAAEDERQSTWDDVSRKARRDEKGPAPEETSKSAAQKETKPAPEKVTRQKAKVGVGKKGSGYGGGLVTTPVAVYFRAQERITYEIQVPHAMNLFKAMNGYAPRTHEEFMEKIIDENNIKLPELPYGYRYIYDPETEQLMVQHPN